MKFLALAALFARVAAQPPAWATTYSQKICDDVCSRSIDSCIPYTDERVNQCTRPLHLAGCYCPDDAAPQCNGLNADMCARTRHRVCQTEAATGKCRPVRFYYFPKSEEYWCSPQNEQWCYWRSADKDKGNTKGPTSEKPKETDTDKDKGDSKEGPTSGPTSEKTDTDKDKGDSKGPTSEKTDDSDKKRESENQSHDFYLGVIVVVVVIVLGALAMSCYLYKRHKSRMIVGQQAAEPSPYPIVFRMNTRRTERTDRASRKE
eukprot:GEMP01039856.1.p1 GENE.GEMP01039856.1~~GEMP01039856.1.p1  ORF type:complete len:261 (+),score=32.06 GEMP01039856.1:280-1062(+)